MCLDELYNFQITYMTRGAFTGRAVQLLWSYFNITKHSPNKVSKGPGTTNTVLEYQAPLCINRTLQAGKVLGHPDQRLCNFTLDLQPSSDWAISLSKQPLFSAWTTISATFPYRIMILRFPTIIFILIFGSIFIHAIKIVKNS